MKKLTHLFAFCFTLLFASAVYADEYVKIGAWNIEHLGARDFGQHPKALAEHVQLAGVDVLALEEIYDTDNNAATRTNSKLDEMFALLNQQTGHNWEYVLFANKDQTDKSQLCGVAWNKARVSKVGNPFRIPVVDDPNDDFETWDRHPHAVKFSLGSGKTDFVVIPVHMKSNVDGASFGREQREAEARALVAKLGNVRTQFGEDKDIIIIGDTNCLDANETALAQFRQSGFKDLNDSDQPTFVNSNGSPFDRIFVPKNQQEFRFSRQYSLISSDHDAHDGFLSDHFLVMTLFRVMPDDD